MSFMSFIVENKAVEMSGDGGSMLVHGENESTTLTIKNCLFEKSQSYGNGGGIFVTTSRHDDNFWFEQLWEDGGAGNGAAAVFEEDGMFISSSSNLEISNNTANRWGGGAYIGISPPWNHTLAPIVNNYDEARFWLWNGLVSSNICNTKAKNNPKMPAQIAAERIGGSWSVMAFDSSTIIGRAAGNDIGIYTYDSSTPSYSGTTFSSVATSVINE